VHARERPDAAKSEARGRDGAVLDLERRSCRGERELVGGPIAHLQVTRSHTDRQQWHVDVRDQLTVLEHVLDVGPVARKDVENR
jgi:hypothetical protein